MVAFYLAYLYSPALAHSDHRDIALRNASQVIDLEQSLGIFWEPIWQSWAIENARGLVLFFNWAYFVTFWPIIGLALFVLHATDQERFSYYRKIMLLSFALALVTFLLYPLAPPYMIEEIFIDTIEEFSPLEYARQDFVGFYNAYAAMPSLHFGWAVMFGAMFIRVSIWWIRAIGIMYPSIMLFTVTISGNHYIVDAIGGVVIIFVSFLAVKLGLRHRHRRHRAGLWRAHHPT